MDSKAPYYPVQNSRLVVVEHPFIVKDVSKGIQSLGGAADVTMLVNAENEPNRAVLSLRPSDHFSRPVESCIITGSNVVMHVQVPRMTGRKRKKGSSIVFQEFNSNGWRKEDQLLRAFRDNPRKSKATAVGRVACTHRFRDPPDFVWSASTNSFLTRFKDTLLSGSYEKTAEFKLESRSPTSELIPPPVLAPTVIPWAYSYRQNIAVKTLEVDGQKHTFNSSTHSRHRVANIRAEAESVPNPEQGSLDDLLKTFPPYDQTLVLHLRQSFDTRPVWTRRGLRNFLRAKGLLSNQQIEHHILAQVAYTFSSGPWRDALVKFGKDPRVDVGMRVYQTMAFRTDDVGKSRNRPSGSAPGTRTQGGEKQMERRLDFPVPPVNQDHVFDGRSVDISGKVWQVCDIKDPTLRQLLECAELRETCDVKHSGWYFNGTWGKVRAIMKAQIRHIVETGDPLDVEGSSHAQKILRIPDVIYEQTWEETRTGRERSTQNTVRADNGVDTQIVESSRRDQSDDISLPISTPQEIRLKTMRDESLREDDREGMVAVMQELEDGSEQDVTISETENEQNMGDSDGET